MTPETLDYKIEIDSKDCALDIFINDINIVSYYQKGPFYTVLGIGEYLKPTDNELTVILWPATNDSDRFDSGSYCKVTLASRNRFETEQLSAFSGIHYHPTDDIGYNTSDKSINRIAPINTHLGKSVENVNFEHDAENFYYTLTQHFDINPKYKVWKWENSPILASKNGYDKALPPKQREALFKAYEELWRAFKDKDLKKIEKLHHEYLLESVEANGGTPEMYFRSLGLTDIINDPELTLAPLSFKDVKYFYSLDKKLVTLYSKTSLIHFLRNNDEDDYVSFIPRYRLDGDKFVISR